MSVKCRRPAMRLYTVERSIGTRYFFFFQAEDGIRDIGVTGVQTCALPIYTGRASAHSPVHLKAAGHLQRRVRAFLSTSDTRPVCRRWTNHDFMSAAPQTSVADRKSVV